MGRYREKPSQFPFPLSHTSCSAIGVLLLLVYFAALGPPLKLIPMESRPEQQQQHGQNADSVHSAASSAVSSAVSSADSSADSSAARSGDTEVMLDSKWPETSMQITVLRVGQHAPEGTGQPAPDWGKSAIAEKSTQQVRQKGDWRTKNARSGTQEQLRGGNEEPIREQVKAPTFDSTQKQDELRGKNEELIQEQDKTPPQQEDEKQGTKQMGGAEPSRGNRKHRKNVAMPSSSSNGSTIFEAPQKEPTTGNRKHRKNVVMPSSSSSGSSSNKNSPDASRAVDSGGNGGRGKGGASGNGGTSDNKKFATVNATTAGPASRDISAGSAVSRDNIPAGPAVSREDTSAAPAVSRDNTSAAPAVSRDNTPAAPAVSRDNTPAAPAVSRDNTPAAPAVSRDDIPAAPAVSRDDIPAAPAVSRDDIPAAPAVSRDDIPAAAFGAACTGRKLYVYPLPARFNRWMVDDCVESRIKGFCLTSRHDGLGTRLGLWDDAVESHSNGSSSKESSSVTTSRSSSRNAFASEGWRNQWFLTDSSNNEEIFHSRLLQHPCRTSDPDSADFLFIPAYLGWSIWSLVEHGLFVDRDQPGIELERFLLEENPDFKRLVDQGNHVLVLGRPIWDFRRVAEWGSDLWWRPTFNNVTLLTVEATREWYGREVFSIPYPTSFHPVGSADLQGWIDHVRDHDRPFLYAFVGGRRAKETIEGALRGALLRECESDPEKCLMLECYGADAEAVTEAAAEIGRHMASRIAEAAAARKEGGVGKEEEEKEGGEEEPQVTLRGCTDPRRVAGVMLQAEFCLQPVGDSQTRRSFFDSIIAGCIPVVFSRDTFDSQYPWFFDPEPEARRKISVMVDPEEVISGRVKIGELLGKISEERKEEMRKELRLHTPRLLIRDHTVEGEVGEEGRFEDMVDMTINGLVERKKLREAGAAGSYFPWFLDR
ncbi:hypothetical protein CLOM_g22293 [Closterium sp. NIES-68]|nr:hypothetical protein CLOM_g22293 [Closterium sp. NIES-68]GJP64434.1 hypothetical protein CLOP_g21426 [Closterium sp. NIES-67]